MFVLGFISYRTFRGHQPFTKLTVQSKKDPESGIDVEEPIVFLGLRPGPLVLTVIVVVMYIRAIVTRSYTHVLSNMLSVLLAYRSSTLT